MFLFKFKLTTARFSKMGLSKQEVITTNEFSVNALSFNSLIYLDWSDVKWKKKNIEKYVLYVLEPIANKKNTFDGAKPLLMQILTKNCAIVQLTNPTERKRLNGRNVGFFVGAIAKGEKEPGNLPSNWKQAKTSYTTPPDVWTGGVDGINLSSCSACSFEDFLANYKKAINTKDITGLLREKNVIWGFRGDTPETRMTVDEANAKLKDFVMYSYGKKDVILLPKAMEKVIEDLKSGGGSRPVSINLSKYKALNKLECLKEVKNMLPAKQYRQLPISIIEYLIWKPLNFYKVSKCSLLRISWTPHSGSSSYYAYCQVPRRDFYEGKNTTCIDKYYDEDAALYLVGGRDWYASFVIYDLTSKPYPFGGPVMLDADILEIK